MGEEMLLDLGCPALTASFPVAILASLRLIRSTPLIARNAHPAFTLATHCAHDAHALPVLPLRVIKVPFTHIKDTCSPVAPRSQPFRAGMHVIRLCMSLYLSHSTMFQPSAGFS